MADEQCASSVIASKSTEEQMLTAAMSAADIVLTDVTGAG